MVLCVVRNGEPWLEDFISHYLEMGFDHLVFLDNGSSDDTVDIARACDAATVLRSDLPFKTNRVAFRRYLVERFGRMRWSLTVDIDEFWDYPFSDRIDLASLLRHFRSQQANAVIAHQLDLFSPTLPAAPQPLEAYRHYDLSAVTKDGLDCERGFRACGFDAVEAGASAQGFYRGGIRAQIFGLETVWLSKMPLLFFDDQLDPITHLHFSRRARIADTSTVLLHYKLIHTLSQQVEDALQNRQYFRDSWEYSHYQRTLLKAPQPQLLHPTARTLHSVDQLVDEGFLTAAPSYRTLADASP